MPTIAADASGAVATSTSGELLLAVIINAEKLPGSAVVVRDADGRLLVRREDLSLWRLLASTATPVSLDGETLYGLDELPGLSYVVDESTQTLSITAPAQLFQGTRVAGSLDARVGPMVSRPGGFINYDVFATSDRARTATNGLLELAGFNAWGVGVTSFLRQDLRTGARETRLASTWTHDRPDAMSSFRVGDMISASGGWGRSVRFGGIQLATNFATQPGFVTFPLPGMTGEAVLPSTLDLYVNDALRLRRNVPAGPFSIDDLPVFTGQGEARLVVTDLLGRQQVITAPYYATPSLLQRGLSAYSYEAGPIRENFGIASNDYGRLMAAATYRSGLTDRFTGELHGEVLEDQQTVGLGAVFLWPEAGVFSASMAVSHSEPQQGENFRGDVSHGAGGSGGLLGAAFQGQNDWLSYGANVQVTTSRFKQLGLERGQPAPRQTSQAYVGASSRALGSLSVSYVLQEPRDADRVELISSNYGRALGGLGYLGISVLRTLGPDAEFIFGLNLTHLVGARTTASVNATKSDDRTDALVRMQRSLPLGDGVGYKVAAGVGDSDRRQAAVSVQNRVGTYTAEVGQLNGETSYRGSASGGVAFLAGDAFASRRINSSFAVVQVPGYAHVGIYQDNQPVARTNANGNALVTRLRPYQVNSLRLEQADLPMDAQVDSLGLKAVPYFRSGLLLSFPVQRSRGAVFTVLMDDGEPLPAGATGRLNGQGEEFPVGFNGQIYVTGLSETNRIAIAWREQHCEFALAFPETNDPLPDLGTYTCSGLHQ